MQILPKKLKAGDEIRVIAPSRSMSIISKESREIANKRFEELGIKLTFGKHIEESDEFVSSSIESRIDDLHNAFADKNVKGILTVIGGFNSNQLLDSIDWDLIKNNPKILCGYSDITILNNAIFAKTGLVTYYGPHYSTFGQKLYFEYTLDHFKKCLMETEPIDIKPSDFWSDDAWYIDQEKRNLVKNNGFLKINPGEAEGQIIGGNIGTFNLIFGSKFMPEIKNTILFLEDDSETRAHHFDRILQSLIYQPGFEGVKGIVVGRFQKESKISDETLKKIFASKGKLKNIPIIANADFGHTDPKITFPVGGSAKLFIKEDEMKLEIVEH